MDQASDFSSNRSRYGIDKLREGNYHEWVWNVQSLLEEANIWHHVTGDIPMPADDEKSTAGDVLKWKELDAKARRTIGFCVSGPLQLPVRQAMSAKEAWDELAAIHAPQDRQTQLHLTRELYKCKMLTSTSLKDHEATFSSIIESLEATGKIMDRMDIITMYLLSLSEEYDSFAREINTRVSLDATFSQVKGQVRVEQQRLQNLKPEKRVSTTMASDGSVQAHYANGKRSFRGKSNSSNNNGSNSGSNNNGSDNGSNNNGSNNGNNAKRKGNCNYCGIPGHYEHECRKKVSDNNHKSNANVGNKTYGGLAYALQAAGDNKVIKDSSIWIADCGATHVMCPDQSMFEDYYEFTQGHEPLVGGINSGLPAVGVGHVPLVDDGGNTEILENVLHVPGLNNGLLSLTRLTMQDGWESTISPNGIVIRKDSFSVSAPIDEDGLVRFKSKASAQQATIQEREVYPMGEGPRQQLTLYGDEDNPCPIFDADDNTVKKRRGRPCTGPSAAEVEEIFPPEALEPETQEPATLPAFVRNAPVGMAEPPALPPTPRALAPAALAPVLAVPELPVPLEPPPAPVAPPPPAQPTVTCSGRIVRPSSKALGYNANVLQGRKNTGTLPLQQPCPVNSYRIDDGG
jgi:hypothetical protein